MPHLSCQKNNAGFTLIECILAIATLAALIAACLSIQTSVVATLQAEENRLKANWALRSAIAQLQYVVEVNGQANINDASFAWAGDSNFKLQVKRTELKDLKVSQFLSSAMDIYGISKNGLNIDYERALAPIAPLLDSPAALQTKGSFSKVEISVTWPEGGKKKTMTEGFFFIDQGVLSNVSLPNAL